MGSRVFAVANCSCACTPCFSKSRYFSYAIELSRRPCMGKKHSGCRYITLLRTPALKPGRGAPPLPDPASRVPRAALRDAPSCRAPGATGTSGTRKSDGTGATRPYKPEIQYGYNKRCALKLRSLRYHYNDTEDNKKDRQKEQEQGTRYGSDCSRMELEEIQESRDITETTDILAERKKEEG